MSRRVCRELAAIVAFAALAAMTLGAFMVALDDLAEDRPMTGERLRETR